jgi:hypothetical protein
MIHHLMGRYDHMYRGFLSLNPEIPIYSSRFYVGMIKEPTISELTALPADGRSTTFSLPVISKLPSEFSESF